MVGDPVLEDTCRFLDKPGLVVGTFGQLPPRFSQGTSINVGRRLLRLTTAANAGLEFMFECADRMHDREHFGDLYDPGPTEQHIVGHDKWTRIGDPVHHDQCTCSQVAGGGHSDGGGIIHPAAAAHGYS